MNPENDRNTENGQERIAVADDREPRQDKKPWVTPVVSESPVNELTTASFIPSGADGGFYS